MKYNFKGNFGFMEFTVDKNGNATGTYQKKGSLTGFFKNQKFSGSWENKGLEGLVEFSITDGILEGNWKKGIEPGPMRSKWKGEVVSMEASEGSENIANTVALQEDFKKDEDTHSIPSDEVILEEKSSISIYEERDKFYEQSLSIAIEDGCVSYTDLESQFKIGPNRSKRIIDQLKEAGIIENDPIGGTDLHRLRDEHKTPVKEDCTEEEMKIIFNEARDLVIKEQRASASLLERKLKLSYNLAAQLMDELESARIISSYDGARARSVLVGSLQELKNRAAEEKQRVKEEAAEEKQAARLAAMEEREERKRISEEKKLERERLLEEKRLAKEAAERQWHCLIKFSYVQDVNVRGAKPSSKKSTFKYCFDDEPSDYDIESVVSRWVDDLDREIDEARLEFEEVLSWRRLKVVKACSQSELQELGYFM
jgi:DNA-binding IscR family transcriptional regulator